MSPEELERVRTAIVIKTYTALIRRHANMTDEKQEAELKKVKRFAKALFYNVRGAAAELRVQLDAIEAAFGVAVAVAGDGAAEAIMAAGGGGDAAAGAEAMGEERFVPAAPSAAASAAAAAALGAAGGNSGGAESGAARADGASSGGGAGAAIPTAHSPRTSQPGEGTSQEAAVEAAVVQQDFELFFGNEAIAKKAWEVFKVDGKDHVRKHPVHGSAPFGATSPLRCLHPSIA